MNFLYGTLKEVKSQFVNKYFFEMELNKCSYDVRKKSILLMSQ
jgi:hypothetical protein